MSTGPVASAVDGEIRPLTDEEFSLFSELIHREAGMHLSASKQALLVARLSRRLRELGLRSFTEYYTVVTRGRDQDEKRLMLERLCTHETQFFRESRQFEFLEQSVFPEWEARAGSGRRGRSIRVWSAGCSTGQEPYSLAMALLCRFPPASGWSVEVVATDLSSSALAKAREGVWPVEKGREISQTHRERFMLKGVRSQEGHIAAGPEIRAVVRFERQNLNDERYALGAAFDLIFCRNVLIYFSERSRRAVIHRMLGSLAPQGILCLGHAESLNRVTDRVRSVGPVAYARAS